MAWYWTSGTVALGFVYFNVELSNGFLPQPLRVSERLSRSKMFSSSSVFQSASLIRIPTTRLRLTEIEEEEKENESVSFDDASQILKEEEDMARAEKSGSNVSEEELNKFESKKKSYEEMRAKIRSRANELNIDKSITTKQAIAEANARAMQGEEKPGLDLSKFGGDEPGTAPEDILTQEEMDELDATSKLNYFEQAKVEFSATKWPTLDQTVKQTALMFVIFIISASFILKLDDLLKTYFTQFGLIPRADEVFDYSNLELPDKWTDLMNDDDLSMM